jgi:hypothetical protein
MAKRLIKLFIPMQTRVMANDTKFRDDNYCIILGLNGGREASKVWKVYFSN